jgi:putative transposase
MNYFAILTHKLSGQSLTHKRSDQDKEIVKPHRLNAFFLQIAPIAGHFQPRRHRLSAREYRTLLQGRFQQWNEVTGVKLVG